METISKDQRPSCLRVYCFGMFKAFPGGDVEPLGVGSKHKIWSLFKYLITQKDSHIPTQTILEEFWPGLSDLQNTSVLRTTLCRLRSLIDGDETKKQKKSYIIYTRDTCAFNRSLPYWMDTEEFVRLCEAAHRRGLQDKKAGLLLYSEALELYQGDFLEEDLYQAWTEVPREYFRRLFINSTIEAAKWAIDLKEHRYAQNLIDKGLLREPLSETLHILTIRVLMELDEGKAAARYYDYCTGLLYRELGIRPSEELKKLYRQIKNGQSESARNWETDDLNLPDETQGPFFCAPEFFHNLLIVERRRLTRSGGEASMVFLELNSAPRNKRQVLEEPVSCLEMVARRCLRKSDVICRLNDSLVVLLLPDTSIQGAHITVEHISKQFQARDGQGQYFLAVKACRVMDATLRSSRLANVTSA